MRRATLHAIGLAVLVSLTGCNKKTGEAIVLEKEHIAAQESPAPTPQPTPDVSPAPGVEEEEAKPRELRPNEIDVDGYVMDKGARGTSKDPRAQAEEQWRVRVRMLSGLVIDVRSDRAHYEKLQPGDRVQVTYQQGKYTGTVWGASID